MIITNNLENALSTAIRIHMHQKRKGDKDTPYAVHPILVAMLLAQHTKDEDIIIAALLHDALEDTSFSAEQIKRKFGSRVLKIVQDVSDKHPNQSWSQRKRDYLAHFKKVSKEACLVSCADKIHNLKSMTFAYKKFGEAMWRNFNASKEAKIAFYEEIYKTAGNRFRHPIISKLGIVLNETRKTLKIRKGIKR